MKRYLFTLLLALGALSVQAQKTPHAIGAHFGGSTIDLEYQYHFSKKNFLDVTAGVFNLSDGFALQGVYNWNIRLDTPLCYVEVLGWLWCRHWFLRL